MAGPVSLPNSDDRSRDHVAVQREYWTAIGQAVRDPMGQNHWVDASGHPLDLALFDEIAAYVSRLMTGRNGGLAVEIGCGNGHLLARVASALGHAWDCRGIDLSMELLSSAPANTVCAAAEAAALPFRDASADLVFAHSVVQYFGDSDYLNRVIREATRILRPGGMLLLMDVPLSWYRELMERPGRKEYIRRIVARTLGARAASLFQQVTRAGRRTSTELIAGKVVEVPVFSGYWPDPDVFFSWSDIFGRISMTLQPFESKPILYRRFRLNVEMADRTPVSVPPRVEIIR